MVCFTTCAIATGFIGSSIALMASTRKHLLASDLVNSLDETQKVIYYSIVEERFRAYIIGAIIGIILSVIYIYYAKQTDASAQTVICSVIVIVGISQYLYYTLVPKSQWMLNHLNDKEQVDRWLEMYKYMSYRCHMGFALGLVGYGLLAWANI